jgi:peptidoglycan/xylan/chitin deacetylase (PgdA/CDA1 family)
MLPAASLYARWRPGIRILTYHRVDRLPAYDQLTVSPARFARQMAYLAGHCRLLALGQAVEELGTGRPVRDGVVVTFDDGYRDNLEHALPVLREHRIPATIFVTAAFGDQSQRHPRYPGGTGRLHLDWEELRALAREPLVTVGSHALTHPHLSRLAPEAAREEIAASGERIARELGRPVEFFCYPSGDFGAREVAMVRAAGYRAAVSVAPGANRPGTPLFELRRTEVTDRDEGRDLHAKLSGAYDPVHLWLHRRRRRRFEAAARAERATAPPGGEP